MPCPTAKPDRKDVDVEGIGCRKLRDRAWGSGGLRPEFRGASWQQIRAASYEGPERDRGRHEHPRHAHRRDLPIHGEARARLAELAEGAA